MLLEADVAERLNLTQTQKEQMAAIRDVVARGPFEPSGDELIKRLAELRKRSDEKIELLLTAQQKEEWKKMIGAEFKGTSQFRTFPFGRSRTPPRPGGTPPP